LLLLLLLLVVVVVVVEVGIATGYRMDERGSIPYTVRFFSSQLADWLCGPSSLLYNWRWGPFTWG
jgi:hypothetical protein